jgi:hypothetical protein
MRDVEQSISDKPKKTCPSCGKRKLKRVLYGGIHCSVSKEPSTVGQLADKNAKKAGRQKMSEIKAKARENRPSPDESLPSHCAATEREITMMTDKQKVRYIMEGKK